MIYLIIGHRGVGKTLWLKKLKRIFTSFQIPDIKKQKLYFIDLDEEIEEEVGKKIDELLPYRNKDKEKVFRSIEKKVLFNLISKYKAINKLVFIAIGAGFKWPAEETISSYCHIIHLVRETDSRGRVFLNRPRLIVNKTPYEEYMSLYSEREESYRKIRDESFVLPEQDFEFDETEKYLFELKKNGLNSIITLNKYNLPSCLQKWPDFIRKRLSWGLRFFELRDDQLDSNELRFLLKIIPKEKQLLSFRKAEDSFFLAENLSSVYWDWPVEKGPPPIPPPILSLHERRKEKFDLLCRQLLKYKACHFKLAVPVNNFEELIQGHLWFLKDPERRSFLPVSKKGKTGLWRWYRQIFGPQMKLHFIRDSQEGISDQPFLYEHLMTLYGRKGCQLLFAAVLGDPVVHSASPSFHRTFFDRQKVIFTKIIMSEADFTKENLCILQKMGLVFVSVTSPLKKKAFQICDTVDSYAQSVRSVNTLVSKDKKWFGSNTDGYGLRALLIKAGVNQSNLKNTQKHVAVWGGGGTGKMLEKELPFAKFYSARTGKVRVRKNKDSRKEVHTVVWAVGRARMPHCVFPPLFWKPRLVLDLNYTEDSPGLEYALLVGADYVSGRMMFEYQAKKQQDFFLKCHNQIEQTKGGV